jgi:SAM-dependent methyltransferase
MLRFLKASLHRTAAYRRLGPLVFYARGKLFDLYHNVDTVQTLGLERAGIDSPNVIYGNQYEGIDARVFKALFSDINIQHEAFEFVDFGSGKGKALLLASEFRFRKITGVEFSPGLHAIAEMNIDRYRSFSRKCKNVHSICMDASSYALPEGPTVFFFFNSFRGRVLESVLANIGKSLASQPRDIILVYVNPELDDVLVRSGLFRKLKARTWYTIYGGVGQRGPTIANI